MKIGYSQISLLSFLIAIVLKAVSVFAVDCTAVSVGFFVAVLLGLVLMGIDAFRQKHFAPAFVFENKFHLSFWAVLGSVGFFVDFVSDSLRLYGIVKDGDYNFVVGAVTVGFEGAFAIISSICMIMVALSFVKNARYDFRELKLLNVFPLLWAVLKGVALLSQIEHDFSLTETVMYLAVISAIGAFYFFAKEVDNKKGAFASSVFSFEVYGFSATLYFVCQVLDAVSDASLIDEGFVLSCTAFLTGSFVYFLEKSIRHYTKLD